MSIVGQKLRADTLGPALGHVTGFPVYRAKWESMGTLHRRYAGCNKNVRAKPFKAQSEQYRNLEYFHTLMSQGLVVNGPSSRK
jgi:sulfur-oxidizing protein SoxA